LIRFSPQSFFGGELLIKVNTPSLTSQDLNIFEHAMANLLYFLNQITFHVRELYI